jgi:hypothetical protein
MVEEPFEEEVICNFFHILQKQAKDKRNEEAVIQTSLDYQGPLIILNFANIEEQKIYSSNNLS